MWFVILGCALAAWVVGYGMGYRRGVTDVIKDDIFKPDHRFKAD